MRNKVIAILPARLGSKRFPSKLLYHINGQPLIYHVYRNFKRSKAIDRLVIATDSKEIADAAAAFGADVMMTSAKHKTGSDRIGELTGKIRSDIYINIQADNLGMKISTLDRLINKFKEDKAGFATIAYRIEEDDELFDPNKVKVIVDNNDYALWFSRYPLPYIQDKSEREFNKQFLFLGHIGIYFFTRQSLKMYAGWKRTKHEIAESLEQLRIIENGKKIKVYQARVRPISVDTKDDLKKIKCLYK